MNMVYCVASKTFYSVVTVDLCSGIGKGLIVEWCLGESLQDLSRLWSHQGQHGIVRGDVTEGDRGREVAGDPRSHMV